MQTMPVQQAALQYMLRRLRSPVREPITLEQAAVQCRIPDGLDPQDRIAIDASLLGYISAAREYVEHRTGRTLYSTLWEARFSAWPAGPVLSLPMSTPLAAVTSAQWRSLTDGAWRDIEGAIVDTDSVPGALVLEHGRSWPAQPLWPVWPIRVQYEAGVPADGELPAAAVHAVLLLVAAMYENREAEAVTDRAVIEAIAMRYGVEAMLSMLTLDGGIR